MKTKEEIFDERSERYFDWIGDGYQCLERDEALKSMQEYADQQTASLQKRIAELEAEVKHLTVDPVVNNPASLEGTAS